MALCLPDRLIVTVTTTTTFLGLLQVLRLLDQIHAFLDSGLRLLIQSAQRLDSLCAIRKLVLKVYTVVGTGGARLNIIQFDLVHARFCVWIYGQTWLGLRWSVIIRHF